ncbi:MAG TPA: molybdenum cofactor guanylyltransferase [Syntrophorhabdales bacterium]|nr:molybdenum cofactor guanylyltransferase [Syntrophorhabdales bacterium]
MTGAILAGGRSRRMGRDKATLPFKNRPIIAYIHGIVKQVLPEVFIISKHHAAIEGIDSPILKDIIPKDGSLVGIASALLYARTDYVFVVGCDMPFLRKEAIIHMMDQTHGEDIVIPRTDAGYEPLHAVYSRSCLPHMLRAIDRNRIKITDLLPFLSVKVVREPALFLNKGVSIFTNINTEEDLALAERLISERDDTGDEGVRP